MAGDAVGDIVDALLLVPADDLRLVMHMAAGITRPGGEGTGMAIVTGASTPMIHGELVKTIKFSWRPGRGRVAGIALGAKYAQVISGLGMAANAIHWRAFEYVIHMTLGTF